MGDRAGRTALHVKQERERERRGGGGGREERGRTGRQGHGDWQGGVREEEEERGLRGGERPEMREV